MKRRTFLRTTAAAAGGALIDPGALWASRDRRADLILRGATIYDGTGSEPFVADLAIAEGRIAGIGPDLSERGDREVDLRGLALAPGFIDIHSHTGLSMLWSSNAQSKIRQGVTTEVIGQDGSSLAPRSEAAATRLRNDYREEYDLDVEVRRMSGLFDSIDRYGSPVNLASMVGSGTIRGLVVGDDDRPATPEELEQMVRLVTEAVADGACGLSSGLEYTPGGFADLAELVAIAAPLRDRGLLYSSHMRNEDDRLFASIEETLAVGQGARIPANVTHLKAQGQRNWWKAPTALAMIDDARAGGLDASFDVYPYIAYSTGLTSLFPIWSRDGGNAAFLERVNDPAIGPELREAVLDKVGSLGSWDSVQVTSTGSDEFAWARGRRMGQLATERGTDPYDLLVQILMNDGGGMVGFGMSEENVASFLAHPVSMVCSDGAGLSASGTGTPHPRAFGAFPRVLGYYVREMGIMPLESAIRKMTSMPAERIGLEGRGRIAPGMHADLVAFDPDRVIDRATFEEPLQYPEGIPHVLVGGEFVIRDDEATGARPGRALRGGGAR